MKASWINILHIYQPPTIEADSLKKAAQESYLPLVDVLKKNPHYKITLNINSCLSYLLYQQGYGGLLSDIGNLIKTGQVELTETAAYHPLLPLLTEKEIIKQIKINNEMNSGLLKLAKKPAGFWLPECAYSEKVGKIIKSLGYRWVVLDEISLSGKLGEVDFDKRYEIKKIGLKIIFRNRKISRSFVPDTIKELSEKGQLPKNIITATDGELYGHRHQDDKNSLSRIINNPLITTKTASEYLEEEKEEQTCSPINSNWDAEENELKKNQPYFLWYNKKNKVQMKLWKLTNLAYELTEKSEEKECYWSARRHLERGMSSCTFWWASGKDFRLFDNPAWKPDEVEKGANELIKAVRSLDVDKKIKIKAEKLYLKTKRLLWLKHWKKTN